jgi:hypothetical protein
MYYGLSGSEFMDLAGVHQLNGFNNGMLKHVDLSVVDNILSKK